MRKRNLVSRLIIILCILLSVGGFFFLQSSYLLKKIHTVLEREIGNKLKQPLLFNLKEEATYELDEGELSESVRSSFETHGIMLGPHACVKPVTGHRKWLVKDETQSWTYIVRKEENGLNVYRSLVSIGGVSGNVLFGLTLTRFAIADLDAQFPPLISVEEIRLKYKLLKLVGGVFFLTDLQLKRPEVNAHLDSGGRLNLADFLPDRTPKSSTKTSFPFSFSRVEVTDGCIRFDDSREDFKISIAGIESLLEGPFNEWGHVGYVGIREGSIEYNGSKTSIKEFRTEFKLQEKARELTEMRLAFGNSHLVASGKTTELHEGPPQLEVRLALSLDLADFRKVFRRQFDMAGRAELDIETQGTLSGINGRCSLRLPVARLNDFQISDLAIKADFSQDSFRLTELNGTLASGQFSGGGEVNMASKPRARKQIAPNLTQPRARFGDAIVQSLAYDGWLRLTGVQVAELLPMLFYLPEDFLIVDGSLNGRVEISADSLDPGELRLSGDLRLEDGYLNATPILVSQAKYEIDEGIFHLVANLDEAEVAVGGQVSFVNGVDVDLKIRKIDVGKLTRILRVPDLSGNGTLTGRISTELPLAGVLEMPSARLFNVPIGELKADFHCERGRVFLHPISLAKGESNLLIDGEALVEGDIPVHLTVRPQPFQISDYVRLLAGGEYPIEGLATGRLVLDGTLRALNGRGMLEIVDGKAWDLAFDLLHFPLLIDDYVLKVSDFELLAREQRGVVDFQITRNLDYQLEFQSDLLSLIELAAARGVPDLKLESEFIVRAIGEGNARDPRVDVNFDFSKITYAGKPQSDVRISGVFMDNALRFEGTGFDGSSQIRGMIESSDGAPYQVFMRSNKIDISPILRIFHESLGVLPANATGTIELAGTLENLAEYRLQTFISKCLVKMNGQQLINMDPITFGFADNVWKVDAFSLVNPDSTDLPIVSFELMLDGESVDFVAESAEISLERLSAMLGMVPTLSGTAHYKLTAGGTLANPDLIFDWGVPTLVLETSIGPVTASNAVGQFTYAKRNVTIEAFGFRMFGNHPIEIEGSMVMDPNKFEASALDFRTAIVDFDLNLISRLLPQVADLDGGLGVTARLTGTLSQPILNASITVADAKARILDFRQPIEDANFDVQVIGGDSGSNSLLTLNVETANWRIGGGEFKGNAHWNLPASESKSSLVNLIPRHGNHSTLVRQDSFEFHLVLDGERVNLTHFASHLTKRNLPRIEGTTDARLRLKGDGHSPRRISAQLVCDDLYVKIDGREMSNIEPIHVTFVEGELSIDSLRLGGVRTEMQDSSRLIRPVPFHDGQDLPRDAAEWVRTTGRIDVDGDLDFGLRLTEFPFAILFPGLSLPLFNNALWIEGNLTSNIQVGGNVADPIIEAEWHAWGRGESTEEFTDTGRAEYRNRLFVIHATELRGHGNQLSMSGRIPIDLAFQPRYFADRFLDEPIEIKAHGEGVNLNFLAGFHPKFEEVSGTARADLRIQGTTASPYFYGGVSVQNGVLKLTDFDTPFSNAQFVLQANKGEVRAPKVSFDIGEGRYSAEIYVGMDGLFPSEINILEFRMENAQISDFARNLLSGKIASNLEGYLTAEGRFSLPIGRFVSVGKTQWLPETLLPLTMHNLISHSNGQLAVKELFIDSLGYEIRNIRPIEFEISDRKLSLKEGFILADERVDINDRKRLRLAGSGEWNTQGQLDFNMTMHNFDLAFISDFVPEGYLINGRLNSELRIGGTDDEPEISYRWNTPRLSVNRADVAECRGEVAYRNRKLYTRDPARLVIGSNRAYLSGLVPFHLSFTEFHAEPLAQGIEGRLDIAIDDLEFLPLILPQIGFAEAKGSINVTVGGQVPNPQLKGVADLSNLAFNITDTHFDVDETNLTVDFTNEGFQIRRCEGLLNGGVFKAEGFVQSDWHRVRYIDLSAILPGGSTFEEPGFYRVRCDEVNLTLQGEVERVQALSLPPVRGTVRVIEGQYERHWQELVKEWFDREADVQFEVWADYPIMRHLRFDLDVVAPNNFWVVSDFGKLKIEASIDGKILGRIQKPVFAGRIDLLPQSEFSLYTFEYPFVIQEGSYVENSSSLEFNPRYEIYAKTAEPIRGVGVISSDGRAHTRDIEIAAHMDGYLKEQQHKHRTQFFAEVLRRGAGEEYDLSQGQIISILATGDVGAFASESSPTGVTVPLFLRPSQRYFGNRLARVTGFHEARFDISPEAFEESRFLLTRELFERLLLTYSSTFQIHAEPRIEVEYQIRRGLSITGERSEQGKYGVDLKLEQRF